MRRTARSVVVDFAELTHPGLEPTKQINEDASAFRSTDVGHLAVVCDGMGGHAAGREASQLAVQTIVDRFEEALETESGFDLIRRAIEAANLAVHTMGGDAPTESRPGATCVAVLVTESGAIVAHVGDSRAVLVRGDGVYPLTRDHSMVQQLVDAGVIAPHEAADHPDANRITRALGMNVHVQVEVASNWQPLRPDDVLLLTTDGVTDLVAAHELRDVVRERLALGPAVVCEEVIRRTNARGGHDNSTIQVIHILDIPHHAERQTLDEPTTPGATPRHRTMAVGTPAVMRASGTSPTIVDPGPDAGGRATEPDLTLPLDTGNAVPRPQSPRTPPPPVPPAASPFRTGLFVAVGLALLVGMTAALALFVRFMRASGAAPSPPLVTQPEPVPSGVSATELVADPEPPPAPTPTLSEALPSEPVPHTSATSPVPATSGGPAPVPAHSASPASELAH